jgi:hypothetical protein
MPRARISDEALREAARASRTLTETLERLGVETRGPRRKYFRDRLNARGVDTSHFEPEVKWSREVLQEAVAASTTMVQVLRRLGIDVVGGHHTHISRRVKAFGIDTSHFRIPGQRGGSRGASHPKALLVVQDPATARRVPNQRLTRAMVDAGTPARCAWCDNPGTWQGEPLKLEVDHVNGDWRDNRLTNLRFLCPNCHATTDTYRGRGKGKREGRAS